jgi:hypothetical protein
MDLKATQLKFLLDLHNHHIGGIAVLLFLLLPLDCNESGGTWVGLVMNGLQFYGILILDFAPGETFFASFSLKRGRGYQQANHHSPQRQGEHWE